MPPFYGDNEQQIFESVMKAPLDFDSEPWPKISEPAKVNGTFAGTVLVMGLRLWIAGWGWGWEGLSL